MLFCQHPPHLTSVTKPQAKPWSTGRIKEDDCASLSGTREKRKTGKKHDLEIIQNLHLQILFKVCTVFFGFICTPYFLKGNKNTWVFPRFITTVSLELQKSKRGKPGTKNVLFWESLQNSRLAIVVDDLGISFKPRCLGKWSNLMSFGKAPTGRHRSPCCSNRMSDLFLQFHVSTKRVGLYMHFYLVDDQVISSDWWKKWNVSRITPFIMLME